MNKNKMLVSFFILSESFFFLMLILAYVNFHRSVTDGPTAASSLNPIKTGIFSLFLLASSFTIWLAVKNLNRKNHFMLCIWLLLTILLGVTFLFGQGLEWMGLIKQNITINRNVFATTFFTLTGFHGFHVTIGLIMLMIILGLAIAGDFKGPESAAVESVSLYWHFVDGVWIVVFSVIYLWELL